MKKEESLKEEAEYKLRQNGTILWKKYIQNQSTKKQYYIQNLKDRCELAFIT